jgi:hypothetical protein
LIHDFEKSIHLLVLFISWINIIIKIFIVSSIGLIEWSNIKSGLLKKLQENLTKKAIGNYEPQKDEI